MKYLSNECFNQSFTLFLTPFPNTLSLVLYAPSVWSPFSPGLPSTLPFMFWISAQNLQRSPLSPTFYLSCRPPPPQLHGIASAKTTAMYLHAAHHMAVIPHGWSTHCRGYVRRTGYVVHGGTGSLVHAFILMCICNNVINISDPGFHNVLIRMRLSEKERQKVSLKKNSEWDKNSESPLLWF